MNWKRIGLLVAIAIFAAVYFTNRSDVQFVKQDGFELKPISESGMELKSVLHIYNPNLLSATIKKVHLQFMLNGILVGELDNELNRGIPGKKETEFPISIRFSKEELNKIAATVPSKDTWPVTLSGEIDFSTLVSSGVAKVEQAGTTSLDD